MLRYPESVSSQQPVLAPLQALIAQVPACETWIALAAQADSVYDTLDAGSLQLLAQIASSLAKVFDYLYTASPQSIYSSQYLLTLAAGARAVAQSATLAAPIRQSGTSSLTLTKAAQTSLSALLAWDAVQGYATPANPGAQATILTQGATVT